MDDDRIALKRTEGGSMLGHGLLGIVFGIASFGTANVLYEGYKRESSKEKRLIEMNSDNGELSQGAIFENEHGTWNYLLSLPEAKRHG